MAGSRLSCGIVGLPNVGKSTLFNAVTSSQAEASNYPFCTIDPNTGIVEVLDPRLAILSKLSHSKQLIYAPIEFVDIAGIVKGASEGEGLGNKFLSHIREVDAIIHVVRCFESNDIIHVAGKVDPLQDIEVINLELILADLQMLENISTRLEKQARGKKEMLPVLAMMQRALEHLNHNLPMRSFKATDEEKEWLKPYPFLSAKPVLYAANVGENDLPAMENVHVAKVREFAEKEGNYIVPICANIEAEIAQLPKEERQTFLQELGLEESGLQRLVHASYDILGLMSFLTTGEIETRAWTIERGTKAAEAAGKIHTDIQKGFIRAEVIAYNDFVAYGGRVGAREAGKVRFEGREYVVQDGDVILFMHN